VCSGPTCERISLSGVCRSRQTRACAHVSRLSLPLLGNSSTLQHSNTCALDSACFGAARAHFVSINVGRERHVDLLGCVSADCRRDCGGFINPCTGRSRLPIAVGVRRPRRASFGGVAERCTCRTFCFLHGWFASTRESDMASDVVIRLDGGTGAMLSWGGSTASANFFPFLYFGGTGATSR
jgi:hypothetical protein